LRGTDLDGRQINVDVAATKKTDGPGGFGGSSSRGGFGGSRGGFGGSNRGGFERSTNVQLNDDDKNAKRGSIGTFTGTIKKL
jgi:hypothetical protein